MANIRLISTSTVLPASSDDHNEFSHRIELTPWDLKLPLLEPIQMGLFFHKPTDSFSLTTTLVDNLKATISQALAIFYPLAGRLSAIENVDDTISFFIDCNGAGALFVHAAVDDVTLADVLDPIIIPDDLVYSFFPMKASRNGEAAFTKSPLLAVQVTELVDGVIIACTMNHCAVDGTSYWHFFNVWSEISLSGLERVSPHSRPVFGRECLDGIVELPISIPLSRDRILDSGRYAQPQPNLQQRMFRFSKEKVAELKAKANMEMRITNSKDTISSLQALLAHLWKSIARNRRLDADEDCHYWVVIGMRQRIQPPLPKEYFGNSTKGMPAKFTAREVLEQGLGWVAWKINRVVASQTAGEARKFLEDWEKSPTILDFRRLPANTLLTIGSPRFDVYGNDFGWGRPIAVRSGQAGKLDGSLTVYPGAELDGSIDFEVCLSTETLEALAQDAEFVETLAK